MKTSFRPLVSSLLAAAILATGSDAWADPAQPRSGLANASRAETPRSMSKQTQGVDFGQRVDKRSIVVGDYEGDGKGDFAARKRDACCGSGDADLLEGRESDRVKPGNAATAQPKLRGQAPNRGYIVGTNGTARAADYFLHIDEEKHRR